MTICGGGSGPTLRRFRMSIELFGRGIQDFGEWTLDGVVKAYSTWLQVKSPGHFKAFTRRLGDDLEAAQGEAAVFNFLRAEQLNPRPGEVLGGPGGSVGGVDFLCGREDRPDLAVEVTVLRK